MTVGNSHSSGEITDRAPVDPGAMTESLQKLALNGSLWTILEQGISYGMRLAGNLILTRLLFEEAFGLMVLVNLILHGLQMFSDVGINASIVQNAKGEDPRFLDTAWTVQLIRGVLLTLLGFALAGPAAEFYGYPELSRLVSAVSFTILISSVASTSLATLRRRIDLRRLALMRIGTQFCALVVTIAWAWIRPSVWALVAGGLVGSLLRTVLSYQVMGGRARLSLHRESLLALSVFGVWVILNTPIGFLADQAHRLVLGKWVPLTVLGVYQIAYMFASMPSGVLTRLGSAVLFPVFSRGRDAGRSWSALYRAARKPLFTIGGALNAGLIACVPLAIQVLYDERWHAAGWMIAPVAIGQWFRVMSIPGSCAVFAMGGPQWVLVANLARLIGYAGFVPLGYSVIGGVLGALCGFAVGELAGFVSISAAVRRLGVRSLGSDLWFTGAVGVSALSGVLAGRLTMEHGFGPLVALAPAAIAAGSWWVWPLTKMSRRFLGTGFIGRSVIARRGCSGM